MKIEIIPPVKTIQLDNYFIHALKKMFPFRLEYNETDEISHTMILDVDDDDLYLLKSVRLGILIAEEESNSTEKLNIVKTSLDALISRLERDRKLTLQITRD